MNEPTNTPGAAASVPKTRKQVAARQHVKPQMQAKSEGAVLATPAPPTLPKGVIGVSMTHSASPSVKEHAASAWSSTRNISVGAMMALLSELPQFFAPLMFVITHLGTLATAALHVIMPLAMSYYAAMNSPVLRESLFTSDLMGMKVFGAVSLFAFSGLSWIACWMTARSLAAGVGRQLTSFEALGEKAVAGKLVA